MNHITTAGLSGPQLDELEKEIRARLQQRADRHAEVYGATDVDKGNWYGLALMHAAEVIALEFKLARGE